MLEAWGVNMETANFEALVEGDSDVSCIRGMTVALHCATCAI